MGKGLYDSADITVNDLAELGKYLSKSKYTGNTIDCFCVHCETNRVFEYADSEVPDSTGMVKVNIFDVVYAKARKLKKEELFNSYLNRRYFLTYRCTRNKEHAILFDLIVSDDKIIKIGQYPSVADLAIPEIAKY